MNLVWDEREARKLDEMWKKGYDIEVIAETLERDCDEVAILIIDRARKGKIKARETGVFGKDKPA
ncbi:hypothetical protein D3C86_2180650 [compost metagenome]